MKFSSILMCFLIVFFLTSCKSKPNRHIVLEFNKEFPSVQGETWVKINDKNVVGRFWDNFWENDYDDARKELWKANFQIDKKNYVTIFSSTGQCIETKKEIDISKAPALVIKAINAKYNTNKKFKIFEKELNNGKVFYEIKLKMDYKDLDIRIDKEGNYIGYDEDYSKRYNK